MKKCISVRIEDDDEVLDWLLRKAENSHLSLDKTIYSIIKEASERTEQEDFIEMLCVNFANEFLNLRSVVKETVREEMTICFKSMIFCNPIAEGKMKKEKKSLSLPKQTMDYINTICK